jgi:tetratricopeptide (TPR) repeat protein
MLVAVVALAMGPSLVHAQDEYVRAYVPPHYLPTEDRNDAKEFEQRGEFLLSGEPHGASEQFLWASRLDPMSATPLYGRALAQYREWIHDANEAIMRGERSEAPSRARMHLFDSLMFASMTRDPFANKQMDRVLTVRSGRRIMYHVYTYIGGKKVTLPDEVNDAAGEFQNQQYAQAIAHWRIALKKVPELITLHVRIAEAFYDGQQYDSAVAELRLYRELMTKKEEKDITVQFESKTIALFSIGVAQVQMDSLAAARASFEEVLTEDLGFYMAHVRLAGVALLRHDDTTATKELGDAAALNETDASIVFGYAFVLRRAGRLDEAAAEFRKAIAVDPYYANSYLYLGRIEESQGRTAEAIASYQAFVDHAAHDEAQLPETVERIIRLSAAPPSRP